MAKGGFVIRGRIDGLDAWRAGLMLGGLLVHGSVLADDLALFRGIELTSAAFRMGAFFAISGMLAALVMARRRPIDWLAKQSVRVGVPALVGILVLSPVTSLTMRAAAADRAHAMGGALFDWHHLWFLFVLLIYQAIAYLLFTRIDRRRFVGLLRRVRAIGQIGVLAAIGLASLLLIGATLTAISEWTPERYWPALLQLRLILRYMPLYFLGFVLGLSRASRAAMLGTIFVPIAMLAAVLAAALLWYLAMAPGADPITASQWSGTMRLVIEAVCPPAAIVLILRSALKIREVRPFFDRLCLASFTIYMLHYPILVAINAVVGPFDWNPYLQYAGAVIFTALFCYALHFRVVERSRTLSLLLNGRLPPLRRTAPVAAV
ncbi:MAG: acyltransferase family protein [Sphingomonas sp.]